MKLSELRLPAVSDEDLANMLLDEIVIPFSSIRRMAFTSPEGPDPSKALFNKAVRDNDIGILKMNSEGTLSAHMRDESLLSALQLERGWTLFTITGDKPLTLKGYEAILSEVDKRPEPLRTELRRFYKVITSDMFAR
jgi:hypothetical protein